MNKQTWITCKRCGATIEWPESLTADAKRECAAAVRPAMLSGIKLAREKFGLSLHDAKAIGMHITRAPGICHRCRSAVTEELSICATCGSANLDW